MRKNIFVMVALTGLSAYTNTHAASSVTYICTPKYSTGYRQDATDVWAPQQYSLGERKYLLSEKDGSWAWKQIGDIDEKAFSSRNKILQNTCSQIDAAGYVQCKNLIAYFFFNAESLRFQVDNFSGYVTNKTGMAEKAILVPTMEIGTCTKILL